MLIVPSIMGIVNHRMSWLQIATMHYQSKCFERALYVLALHYICQCLSLFIKYDILVFPLSPLLTSMTKQVSHALIVLTASTTAILYTCTWEDFRG